MGFSLLFNLSFTLSFITTVFFSLIKEIESAAPTDLNSGKDHRAHAVPRGPYFAPDLTGDGWSTVNLDGRLSHSHFFDPVTDKTGHIVRYEWNVDEEIVCRTEICPYKFPVGVTTVSLSVVDNTGDFNAASTTVTVFSATKPEILVWIYDRGWIGSNWREGQRPVKAFLRKEVDFRSDNDFLGIINGTEFSVRILGMLKLPRSDFFAFRVICKGGDCLLRVGNDVVFSGPGQVQDSKFIEYKLEDNPLASLELLYRRRKVDGPEPELGLEWRTALNEQWETVPAQNLFHVPQAYYPVLSSISPKNGNVGDSILLQGTSFLDVRDVYIGRSKCLSPTTESQYSIRCVIPGAVGKINVTVLTKMGESNVLSYKIGQNMGMADWAKMVNGGVGPIGYYQPVEFKLGYLKHKDGSVWKGERLTAITIGPDLKYYIGSLLGFVHVIAANIDHILQSHCKSAKVGHKRSVLGVAINPADVAVFRLYVSTSVLFWYSKRILEFEKGWHNGEVIEMQSNNSHCLYRTRTVVSGLPVSNYDHAVNGISFDQLGNLLVTVAGTSNAGVSGFNILGGIPDSPLSGAMLHVPLSIPGFDGHVKYSQYKDPSSAKKVSGDVEVYASGLRNSFCPVVHSNGNIYATDNGANAGFGAVSTGCMSEKGSKNENDSLHMIEKGSYYGYANRNRGTWDEKQCVHKAGSYRIPIAQFESSTNGLIEYTANTFGGQMRGDLVATKYVMKEGGKTFRIRLNESGQVLENSLLAVESGITAAMSPTGAIVMAQMVQNQLAVLIPTEINPGFLRLVVTSVFPFRGPRGGKNIITITGWNLYSPVSVQVGGQSCGKVMAYNNGRILTCEVPSGKGKVGVTVTRYGVSSKSFGHEYWYMEV